LFQRPCGRLKPPSQPRKVRREASMEGARDAVREASMEGARTAAGEASCGGSGSTRAALSTLPTVVASSATVERQGIGSRKARPRVPRPPWKPLLVQSHGPPEATRPRRSLLIAPGRW
jgi:hypothetical protein